MTTPKTSPERILFLVNIRYLMVLFIIIFHASLSYCTIVPWWCVVDSSTTRLPVYSGVFILGIYAYHRAWLNAPLPGHYMLWFILAGILSFVILILIGAEPTTIQPGFSAATGVVRAFLVLSCIFAFMNLGAHRGPLGSNLHFARMNFT